ncbi:hypothetical protein ScPMuIL_002195 [Solemya velum]
MGLQTVVWDYKPMYGTINRRRELQAAVWDYSPSYGTTSRRMGLQTVVWDYKPVVWDYRPSYGTTSRRMGLQDVVWTTSLISFITIHMAILVLQFRCRFGLWKIKRQKVISIRCCVTIISTIYRKVVILINKSRNITTISEILNLMYVYADHLRGLVLHFLLL